MTKPKADLLPKPDHGLDLNVDAGPLAEVTLYLNPLEVEHLSRLQATGFFGASLEITAHRLLDEALAARCL